MRDEESEAGQSVTRSGKMHVQTKAATPYHRMVEGLGGYGELVTEPAEIRPALDRAFASGVPACINVIVDPSLMRRSSYLG